MKALATLVISHADRTARQTLCLQAQQRGFLAEEAADGPETLRLIERLHPAGVLLSLTLPVVDGLYVLESLGNLQLSHYPCILALTAMGRAYEEKALALGADGVLTYPFSPEEALETFFRLSENPVCSLARMHAQSRMAEARNIVEKMGMPRHLKGFEYLAQSVALCSAQEDLLHASTRQLYPCLAQMEGTSSTAVERAIRHAIESTWNRGDVETLNALFVNSIDPQRGKPTNAECIARLCQQLLETMGGT